MTLSSLFKGEIFRMAFYRQPDVVDSDNNAVKRRNKAAILMHRKNFMSMHNLPALAVATAALLFASTAMAQESVTTDAGTINREPVVDLHPKLTH